MRASIVVPVHNGEATIARCLEALLAQDLSHADHEIIVVDDGSTDGTAALVSAWPQTSEVSETSKVSAQAGGHVRLLCQSQRGAASARNRGIRAAAGEFVLFTDADCRPRPDWARTLVEALEQSGAAAAKGTYATAQTSLVARFVQVEYETKYRRMARAAEIDFVDTYSAAYRRGVLDEVGGFDEQFPGASVEDQELSFRVAARGLRMIYVPGAVVEHLHADTMLGYARKKYRIGYWKTLVLAKHPAKLRRDSHTPQMLKLEMALTALLGLTLPLGLVVPRLWLLTLANGLALVGSWALAARLERRDPGFHRPANRAPDAADQSDCVRLGADRGDDPLPRPAWPAHQQGPALGFREEPHAILSRADIDLGIQSGDGGVLLGDFLAECLDEPLVALDQVDRASAKASAGHAASQHPLLTPRGLGHHVQLVATHLVVIAQADVRRVHELAKAGDVPCLQGLDRVKHALVLGDHVPTSLADDGRELLLASLECLDAYVAQGADAEDLRALLALLAPGIVLRVDQPAPLLGVADDQAVALGDGNQLVFQTPTVDEQRVVPSTEGDDILVHDPTAHADELVLGPLAENGPLDPIELEPSYHLEGVGRRDLQRSRGTQPRGDGHIAGDHHVHSVKRIALPLQRPSHAPLIVAPSLVIIVPDFIEGELGPPTKIRRVQRHAAILPRSRGNDHVPIDGRRQDEPIVIVGVLADQVHSSGGRYQVGWIRAVKRSVGRDGLSAPLL